MFAIGTGRIRLADAELPSISADGRFVAFNSEASNLHSDDTDGDHDETAIAEEEGANG